MCIRDRYISERALLLELSQRKGYEVSLDELIRLSRDKDPDALFVHQLFLKYMSIGLNNVLNTLNVVKDVYKRQPLSWPLTVRLVSFPKKSLL